DHGKKMSNGGEAAGPVSSTTISTMAVRGGAALITVTILKMEEEEEEELLMDSAAAQDPVDMHCMYHFLSQNGHWGGWGLDHSPAARILTGVLQSGTRMQLQLAESDPNLLEIGGNVDETLRLLRDHEQLLSKLKVPGPRGPRADREPSGLHTCMWRVCDLNDLLLAGPLRKHDGGMWGLLEQADKATAQCAQLHGEVHKAMARTLSDAWSTLIVLLERRVELLRLASEFFACAHERLDMIEQTDEYREFQDVDLVGESAELKKMLPVVHVFWRQIKKFQFAVRIDEAEDFQRDMEEVTTMACEEAVLLKHCCIKRGKCIASRMCRLLEKSMSVMNKSQELLDVLRGFGAEPALPRSAAAQGTRTSCGRVECLMEVLQDRRRHVDERLTQRSLRLKGLLRISQWKERKQEVSSPVLHGGLGVLQWFKDNAEVYFQKDQLGSTLTENEELLEACKDFALKARALCVPLGATVGAGQRLACRSLWATVIAVANETTDRERDRVLCQDWSSQVEKLLLEASGVTVVPDAVDAKQLAEKSLELKALRDELWRLLVARQEDLQEGHAFFSAANQAFEALAALGAELHVPRSQAVALPQLARRHEDLGRSARE
ncbi:hypothetical protein Z043_123787, partial [Scleropages formosus]